MNIRCLVLGGFLLTVACGGEDSVSMIEEEASINAGDSGNTEAGGTSNSGSSSGNGEAAVETDVSEGSGGSSEAPGSSVDEGEIGSINREVLMLGDSLLAWFREEGASVGDVLDASSSFSVANLSVSGSMVLEGDESIPSQYVGGDWGWVVFDGGGNDANDLCECGACDEILDEIIGEATNEGVVPDFARAMRNAGHRVLVLGYYGMPASAQHGFHRCNDEAAVLNERYERYANQTDGVYYFNLGTVVSPDDLRDYDDDHVHPSARGTQRMGEAIGAYLEQVVR